MVLKAKDEFHSGKTRDPQACKVKLFTVVKPFASGDDGVDDPLFLTGRVNDTILTFDLPFELHIGTPPDWIVDGSCGGLWAIYCMKVKILADQIKVLESGVAFLQCLSMTCHFTNLDSAAEVCKKMLCRKPPPPASSASSSAVPTAGVMVPAQQALPAVPILVPENQHGNVNPWLSMVDY